MKRLLFSIIFKQNVKKINKISKINKKNFVYYCELENNCYAIKIYRNRYNAVSRYNNELFWLSQFQEKKFFGVPKIYLSRKIIFWNILVIDWIDGVSIKQQIENNDNLWIDSLYNCLSILEKIWDYKVDFDSKVNDSFDYKSGKKIDNIIKKLKCKKKNLASYYDDLLHIYKSMQNDVIFNKSLINSDISLHEFLLYKDKMTLLDYEYFCMGDINNDLAGIFYSASTSLINNDNEIGLKSLYKIISNNKHFKLHNFIFFLIQRLVLADYFAGKSIKDFERIRYHRIIIELYFEKHIR